MRDLEKNLKALANKRRLTILKYLKEKKEASVTEIAHKISLSFKATSKHLGVLSSVDMLEKDQRSLQVFYRLASSPKEIVKRVVALL